MPLYCNMVDSSKVLSRYHMDHILECIKWLFDRGLLRHRHGLIVVAPALALDYAALQHMFTCAQEQHADVYGLAR